MFKKVLIWSGIVFMLLAAGCNRQSSDTGETKPEGTAQTPPVATAPAPASIKTGTVAETMDAAGYTYMLVDDGTTKTWVAVLKSDVAVGQEVSYYDGMVMTNFVSKTLGRTFDSIVFSNGLVSKTESGSDSFAAAVSGESQNMISPGTAGPGSTKAIVPFAELQVEKAEGENSYTVGDLYAKASELNGQMVKVRGKVMKVSPHIMGRNWIHIQDGTGSPDNNTHDLVVTTTAAPEDNWDIVTISGVVAANKDFGSGYSYAVLLEEAEVSK
jgi:hypothetical protein